MRLRVESRNVRLVLAVILKSALTIRCPRDHVAQVRKLVFRKLELVFVPRICVGLTEGGSASEIRRNIRDQTRSGGLAASLDNSLSDVGPDWRRIRGVFGKHIPQVGYVTRYCVRMSLYAGRDNGQSEYQLALPLR